MRIAIIGSGISGLACAWLLKNHHSVTIFEKDDRLGGHTHTLSIPESDRRVSLDTGFMVYNEVTYPLLTRFFNELDVATKPTSMSFSVQHVPDNLEFNGGSLNLLFGQRKNLLRIRYWRMLSQIARFNRETLAELKDPKFGDLSLKDYVRRRRYGTDFLNWYLSPMAAAVWSSPPEKIRDFPARTLMRFWHNHGFLGLNTQHPWRTVIGGANQYVQKINQSLRTRIRNEVVAVDAVACKSNRLRFADGSNRTFDVVIFASHADQSLKLLSNPSPLEQRLLSPFRYQKNQAIVHTDSSFMPKTRRCWASWNYRVGISAQGDANHSTHYWMNSLQGISDQRNYFVSINPPHLPEEQKIIKSIRYEHPLFDFNAIQNQEHLHELHQDGHLTGRFFCGAWQKYGFHEDGIHSAVRLCESILGKDPWP